MSACIQGGLENGNNMAAPYPGHFSFHCVLFYLVTWETELKGKLQKDTCIKGRGIDAYIKSQISQIYFISTDGMHICYISCIEYWIYDVLNKSNPGVI